MSDSLWSEDDVQRITVSGLAPRRSWIGRQLDKLSPRKRKIAREWKSEWAQRDVQAALANMPEPSVTVSGDSTGGSFTITFNGDYEGSQTTAPISSLSGPFDVELALLRLDPLTKLPDIDLDAPENIKRREQFKDLLERGDIAHISIGQYQDDNGVWHIGEPPDGDLLNRLTAANDEMIFQGLQEMPSARDFITRGVPAEEDPMSYGDSITAESDQILSIVPHGTPWHGDGLKLLHNDGWRPEPNMGVPVLALPHEVQLDLGYITAMRRILTNLTRPRNYMNVSPQVAIDAMNEGAP